MKAILVPMDLDKPMVEVEAPTMQKLAEEHWDHPSGKWIERVNTVTMANQGFLMVVDDDGLDYSLGFNIRAMLIAQYAAGPIVGDVFLACETQTDFGIDFVDVKPEIIRWVEGAQIELLAKTAMSSVRDNN